MSISAGVASANISLDLHLAAHFDSRVWVGVADPKALDFTLANPGWDLLAADVADTYRTYVDRKPKIGL